MRQSTSALEGTYAPFAEVLAAEAEDQLYLSAEVREILNFERMAELAFSWPEDRPMTIGMLGELQRTLVTGTARCDSRRPCRFTGRTPRRL